MQLVGLAETVERPAERLHFLTGRRVIFGAVVALKLAVDALQLAHIGEQALVVDDSGLKGVGAGGGQQGQPATEAESHDPDLSLRPDPGKAAQEPGAAGELLDRRRNIQRVLRLQPLGAVGRQLPAHVIGRERDEPRAGVSAGDLPLRPSQAPHAGEQHHPWPRLAVHRAGEEGVGVDALGLVAGGLVAGGLVAGVQRHDTLAVGDFARLLIPGGATAPAACFCHRHAFRIAGFRPKLRPSRDYNWIVEFRVAVRIECPRRWNSR